MSGGFGGGVGAACSLALILALAVLVGLWLLAGAIERDRKKANVERHIDDLYEAIRTKAVAAAAADYSGLPQPLFDLLTTLKEKLGPLLDLGGALGSMVDKIRKALNQATSSTPPKHPVPAQGETILLMPNPPTYTYQTGAEERPSANSELQKAAHAFNTFWGDKPRVIGLIRETLKKLGGDDLF